MSRPASKRSIVTRTLALGVIVLLIILGPRFEERATGDADVQAVRSLFDAQRSGVMVTVEGSVKRLLADDGDGSRHQRFIIDTPGGLTVLVAHNVDLAPRVADLRPGDAVRLHGQYEWNDRGGVIHWTHDDPANRHEPGWIEHGGNRYR